ncbi:DEAD/DEAH box helicase [Rathayibacter sp. VKM Ac-2928]|uniref:DEAD/DEAH box helicase n=1 Tax=Rathayibacter sp. VKM Ac-2928 TaxID=2929479 RepID=UPI001FB32067|nr:DEAD/DEAH box helicase [Rathayibacter sp. VKM Ac-2928]MCJ1682342.1 DEAD/DEAH box helicase [Rathayibacter sp. VKM Ac-2928]
MSIFSGIGAGDLSETTLDPKRLFRVLPKPKKSKFVFPHDIQTEVWDAWFDRRAEADLVVKMNTGSGKTVIGLLVARSSLNEGVGPAVYLVPNLQLQEQVTETATELGLRWTDDPMDAAFRQGNSILITTAQKIFNGKTKFGLEGSGSTMEVGTIVIDDAHACIPIIEDQFSLRLKRKTAAYKTLLERFDGPLKEQSLSGWTSIKKNDGIQAVPVPYWSWEDSLTESYAALNSVTHDDEESHKFKWPLIKNNLRLCEVAFTSQEVEVRLPYPDLAIVPSFLLAKRRIYMTATLADDSILTSRMKVDATCVTNPIVPASASDIGDRIILTPVETSRAVSTNDVMKSAASWSEKVNVVVLTPSRTRADEWKHLTTEIHQKETVKDVVKRLKAGHVGLVVLIARYDGVDLPADACRVLVIDGLPERYNAQDLVEAAAIRGTGAMSSEQSQRIEQGMGRGVRATDDYCAVILLDPRLVGRLYSQSDLSMLSPGTRAQYQLSSSFAAGGSGKSIEFFDEAIKAFLARDSAWTAASKDAVDGLVYTALETIDPLVLAERNAFALALLGRYEDAADALRTQFDAISDSRYRGWIKQRAASYLHKTDPSAARQLQSQARIDSNFILKVPDGVKAKPLKDAGNQAIAAAKHLLETYPTFIELQIAVEGLLLDLTPSEEKNSHKKFEASLAEIGRVIGLSSSRPDSETGIGPDNLWALGNGRFWVIECKSEATANQVSREYLEQLSHSADWFEREYDMTAMTYLPVMIHPSRLPMWDAVPRQSAKCMTFDRLQSFRESVQKFISAIGTAKSYVDVEVVKGGLAEFGLVASSLESRWTAVFKASAHK